MIPGILLLDGSLIPADEQTLKSFSPGVLKAEGVFETMRACDGRIFLLDRHLQRLSDGLRILKIKAPCSSRRMKEQICLCLRLNFFPDAKVRLTVWRRQGKSHIVLVSQPYHPFTKSKYQKGFQAVTLKIRRKESPRLSSVKSLDCSALRKAYTRARRKGKDEALLLNREGYLVEGSRSNVFLIVNGELWTPALECGCLKGITRGAVIALARDVGVKLKMVRIKPDQLEKAQEAFLTNSLMGVMPLTSIDGKKIGRGRAGPVTLQILKQYRTLIEAVS